MDSELFDAWTQRLNGCSRRQVLAGLLGASVAAVVGTGQTDAAQSWRCCGALCTDAAACEKGNRIHVCVKAESPCPPPPPGYRVTCRRLVRNCSSCGKTTCPARE